MTRTTTLRRGLVAALAAVAATGALQVPAHAGSAPGGSAPTEVTIPPMQKPGPVGYPVVADDAAGYILRDDSDGGSLHYIWHSDDGSRTRDLGVLDHLPQAVQLGDGSTLLWDVTGGKVQVYDFATEVWKSYTLPADRGFVRILPKSTGWTVAATSQVPGAQPPNQLLHLLDPESDGSFTDRPVTGWPVDGTHQFGAWGVAPGATVVQFSDYVGNWSAGLVDPDTATLTTSGPEDNAPLVNHDVFGWGVGGAVQLRPRSDPQATPRTLKLPGASGTHSILALTDTALLTDNYTTSSAHGTIYSVPLDGGPATVLLDDAGGLRPTADGGALFDTADGYQPSVTYKVPADGGAPTVLHRFPIYQPEHIGLSLARGYLGRVETSPGPGPTVLARMIGADVGVAKYPAVSGGFADQGSLHDASIPRCDVRLRCLSLTDGGALGPLYLMGMSGGDAIEGSSTSLWLSGTHGGRIISASGPYVVYDSGSNGEQYVVDLSQRSVLRTRPITAAALWGDTLWSATTTPGQFTAADAATGTAVRTVTTDAPCVPDEIQVLDRWLYWSCGTDGPAGVWDSTTAKSVPVPAGKALLGDGFVLRHAGGNLVLTDVHSGTAADRTVAALPAGAYSDDRGITWTIDKFHGFLAYTDTDGTTHVLPSGAPQSPIHSLSSTVSPLADVSDGGWWQPQWTLDGPASWRLELRKKGTSPVMWSSWGQTRASVNTTWVGRNNRGLLDPNGDYTWTLTLSPTDGNGPSTTSSGTVTLSGGAEATHDYSGDDVGDLLALTSDGRLDVHPGTGTAPGGVGAASLKGTGWPAGSTIVPIGDLSGDHVNDLLVRDSVGRLIRYDGVVGQPGSPKSPSKLIGSGWNTYNALTSPGDMNGDGHPDLLARDAKGDLYLYAGTASGMFAPRVKIGYGYQIYNTLVGVWSRSSEGQDSGMVARDKAGVLWLYQNNSQGRMSARMRIGAGWNIYNALVGVGDVNGDGSNDLVARDVSGNLWRYDGKDGISWYKPRVKIGWGWQSYKALL